MTNAKQDKQNVEGTELKFGQLVNAAQNRADFNIDLATEALLRGDMDEYNRFMNNASGMLELVTFAREENDGTYLNCFEGWESV